MEQSPAEAGNCLSGQEFLSFCRTWGSHCGRSYLRWLTLWKHNYESMPVMLQWWAELVPSCNTHIHSWGQHVNGSSVHSVCCLPLFQNRGSCIKVVVLHLFSSGIIHKRQNKRIISRGVDKNFSTIYGTVNARGVWNKAEHFVYISLPCCSQAKNSLQRWESCVQCFVFGIWYLVYCISEESIKVWNNLTMYKK